MASSSSRTRGFLTKARAIAMRCFCPPDSCVPLEPNLVSYPCNKERNKDGINETVLRNFYCELIIMCN